MTNKFYYCFPTHLLVSDSKRPEQQGPNILDENGNYIMEPGYMFRKRLKVWTDSCEQINYAEGEGEKFFEFAILPVCEKNPTKTPNELSADGILIEHERVRTKTVCKKHNLTLDSSFACNNTCIKKLGCQKFAYFVPLKEQTQAHEPSEWHTSEMTAAHPVATKLDEPSEESQEVVDFERRIRNLEERVRYLEAVGWIK